MLGGTVSTIILQGYVLRTSPSLVYGGLVVVLAVGALVRIGGHVSVLVVGTSAGVLVGVNNYCNANGLDTVGLLGIILNRSAVCGLPIVNGLTGQNLNVLLNLSAANVGVQSEYYCLIADGVAVDLVVGSDNTSASLISRMLITSHIAGTQSLQGVGAVAASRIGVQLVNVRIVDLVGRINVLLVCTSGASQLGNLNGLGGTVQEVSLYLLGGGACHAVAGLLKVGYNQNVGRSSLGLLSVYNVVANDSKIVGAARLNGSGVISNRAGSNLVPGVVDLNFLRSRRLNRSNLGGNYIDLSNRNVVRSGVGLIGNYSPVILSETVVDVDVLNIVGANAIGDGYLLGTSVGNLANLSRGNNYGINLVVAVGVNQLNSASNLIDCSSLLDGSYGIGGYTLVSVDNLQLIVGLIQLVLGAVHLGLHGVGRNVLQLTNSTGSDYLGIVISVYAVNVLIAIGLNANQNLNLQAKQIGNVGRNLGELLLLLVISILNLISKLDLVGVLTRGLLNRSQNFSRGLVQIHVLLADGLLTGNVGSVLEVVDVVRPYNALHVQCVVQNLCSVLTRQSSVQISVNILEQVVQLTVLHGVLSPSCAGQASLLSIVASSYQYHLCSLETGYGIVRSKLGYRLTSDDASVLQVTYVALCPSCGRQIGKLGRQGSVGIGIVVAAIHDRKDHLCHLSTGNGGVRLERAVFVTLNYAQRREHVYSGGCLDVSLVAVRRRTSEHGECASKRQHQCKNLFEILHRGIPPCKIFRVFTRR